MRSTDRTQACCAAAVTAIAALELATVVWAATIGDVAGIIRGAIFSAVCLVMAAGLWTGR